MGNYTLVRPNWLKIKKWQVMYLIINDLRQLGEIIKIVPDKQFDRVVNEHVTAYVEKQVMPPADIAPAIINLADDFMSGRDMTLRAGDYIAIQNYIRKAKVKAKPKKASI